MLCLLLSLTSLFFTKIFNVLTIIDMSLTFLLHVYYLFGFIMVLCACLFCRRFLFFLCAMYLLSLSLLPHCLFSSLSHPLFT